MIRDLFRRKLSALTGMALAASAVCGAASGCASSKCGQPPIQASHSGKNTNIGSCGGGDFGAPVTHPEQVAGIAASPITIKVGEKLTFAYRRNDSGYPHGAAVTAAGVARVDSAPTSGKTIAVIVGVAPGTTMVTIDPAGFCGDTTDRCAIAAIAVTAG